MQLQRESPIDEKRKNLNRRYAKLSEQYTLINQQIDETIDEGQRVSLKDKAEKIYKEMEDIDTKLKQLDKKILIVTVAI